MGIKRVTFNYSTPTVSFLFKTVKLLDKKSSYLHQSGRRCLFAQVRVFVWKLAFIISTVLGRSLTRGSEVT